MKFFGVISEDVTGIALTVIALVIAWGWKEYVFFALDDAWKIRASPTRMLISMIVITILGLLLVKVLYDTTHSCHFNKLDNGEKIGPNAQPLPDNQDDD